MEGSESCYPGSNHTGDGPVGDQDLPSVHCLIGAGSSLATGLGGSVIMGRRSAVGFGRRPMTRTCQPGGEAIRCGLGLTASPVSVGVRTGDTSAQQRRRWRDEPPHLLITTPESLALLLSQPAWHGHWRGLRHIIIDEVHALVPNKRGADLA